MQYTEEVIEAVWQHARTTAQADPAIWRQDVCGAWIRRDHFARRDSEFGWKIEHMTAGSPRDAEHLRAFHWRNRFDLANQKPHCKVRADRRDVPAGEFSQPPHNFGF